MNKLKDKYFPVLDYGFCAVVDSMGDDKAITRAARCSYGAGTKKVSDDRRLIRTLMREMHTSPFEMCELVLHVGMPIFVARQWVRHRTASLNEYSGRYSVMPALFYDPEYKRHLTQNKSNKQGSSHDRLGEHQYATIIKKREAVREQMVDLYETNLSFDLARELSRIDLPLSTYTYWYWKIDLKNLLHFLNLRLDSHAQWEIQQYARVIAGVVKEWLPVVWEAFDDYVLNGITFSRQEQAILKNYSHVLNEDLTDDEWAHLVSDCYNLHMSIRETNAFIQKLKFLGGGQFFDDIELDIGSAKSADYYKQLIEASAIEV